MPRENGKLVELIISDEDYRISILLNKKYKFHLDLFLQQMSEYKFEKVSNKTFSLLIEFSLHQ